MKSAIFELHKRYTPQNKAENNRHSDLKKKQRICYENNINITYNYTFIKINYSL